ncbi:MAG: hypothetical protein ACI4QJ_04300 [Candidatus Spyradenecus sp.]
MHTIATADFVMDMLMVAALSGGVALIGLLIGWCDKLVRGDE